MEPTKNESPTAKLAYARAQEYEDEQTIDVRLLAEGTAYKDVLILKSASERLLFYVAGRDIIINTPAENVTSEVTINAGN